MKTYNWFGATGLIFLVACGASGTGGADPSSSEGLKVFMTASRYAGDLGGREGANQRCQKSADIAGLKGTFVAVIADGSADAIAAIPESVNGPWRVVATMEPCGAPSFDPTVFKSRLGILGEPNFAPQFTETGEFIGACEASPLLGTPHSVWSGAEVQGVPSAKNCADWSDKTQTGLVTNGHGFGGSGDMTVDCNESHRLLCVQIR